MPDWIEARATAHIFDWEVGDVRPVDVDDNEIEALLRTGLLVAVSDENRVRFPPPAPVESSTSSSGCGCGK